MTNVAVIYGSVREGRLGLRVAKFVVDRINKRGGKATLVDPLDYKLPILEKKFVQYGNGKAPKNLQKLHEIFENSDAFIIVTAEYNHGVPPALKNIIDHFGSEYAFKPSAIVSYSTGPFGGVRAAMQWRVILPEAGMPTIPTIFPVPFVQDAFDDDGKPKDEKYNDGIKKFLDEFDWYVGAFKDARKKGMPY